MPLFLNETLYVSSSLAKYSRFETENLSPAALVTDIDECSRPDTNQCDSNALCNNTDGSYICSCPSGYQGDGRNCIGKDLFLRFITDKSQLLLK